MQASRFLVMTIASCLFAWQSIAADDVLTIDVVQPTADHPRHDHQLIFPLADGRLLLIWSEYYRLPATKAGQQRDDMPCRIAAKVSEDRGRTWGETYVFQENTGKLNVKHPNLLRLKNGDVLFFFTEWNSMQERIVKMRCSTDDCKTWSEPVRVSLLAGVNNINNDHVLMLRSGRIVLPAFNSPSVWDAGDHWQAFCYYSDDDARTWQKSENTIDLPKRGAEEPAMVQRRDGSLLCLLRTSLGAVYWAESLDAGRTWSKAESTGLVAPASPPTIKRMPTTGDLLVLWNRNYQPTHHHQGERRPLSAAVSRDDGKTWEAPHDVEKVPAGSAAYSTVFFQDDEALVTYYYQERGIGGQSGIRLKILPVAWFYETK
jgi:sialidase-1